VSIHAITSTLQLQKIKVEVIEVTNLPFCHNVFHCDL